MFLQNMDQCSLLHLNSKEAMEDLSGVSHSCQHSCLVFPCVLAWTQYDALEQGVSMTQQITGPHMNTGSDWTKPVPLVLFQVLYLTRSNLAQKR